MMMHEYTLPNRELLDAFPYRCHDTGWLMPRKNGSARLHIPFHYIAGAQPTGAQLHQQLAGANFGSR